MKAGITELARQCCGLEPQPHHLLFIDRLEALERRDIRRLMIFAPPGSAKSTYASKLFPVWYLGRNPGHQVIAASHTDALALDFSRYNRRLVSSNSRLLGFDIAPDAMAAGHWSTTAGGSYLACGTGQAIMGFRADLIVIDDPIASRADADSENVRNSIWTWFNGDLTTRLKPAGLVVLIMTRYHEDDLAGRLLARMEAGGERWEVVSLTAEAEAGDILGREPGVMLWDGDPGYRYADHLREAKANQDARNWSSMYMQRPTPAAGDYFKEEWLIPYTTMPNTASMRIYAGSDYAVTKAGGDFTVHAILGVDPKGDMWLLDLWRKQAASDAWVDAFIDLARKWKPVAWAEESGQIKGAVGPFLTQQMRAKNVFTMRQQFSTSRGDKSVRAQSIRGRMANIGLRVPVNAPWYSDFRSELLFFPAGRHDDCVDALGLIGQMLDTMLPGKEPKAKAQADKFDPSFFSEDPYRSSTPGWSDYAQNSVKLM